MLADPLHFKVPIHSKNLRFRSVSLINPNCSRPSRDGQMFYFKVVRKPVQPLKLLNNPIKTATCSGISNETVKKIETTL